jgi:hypothetical protein
MFDNIWEAIKTHKWAAIGIGGAVIVGVIIYAVTHKSSSTSSTNNAQDLLATPASGPSGIIGDNSTAGGGGSGISSALGASPANGSLGVDPVDGSNPTTFTPVPTVNVVPTVFSAPSTNPAPPSTQISVPANEPSLPIGLSGVNYSPSATTPNQLTVGSANGLTQIALPAGESVNTPVTVPNAAAGNPTVPLGDLISTGSTDTLSSAYGTAASSAAIVGDTSQLSSEGGQASALALAQQQIAFANTGSAVAKTTPASTSIISSTPAKTTIQATSSTGAKTVVSTAPAAGHVGVLKPS